MRHKYSTKILIFILWVVSAHCILSTLQWVPPGYSIKTAQYFSLFYLVLGLFFLFFNKFRLLLVSFGCSAAISFIIHEMTIPVNARNQEKKMWNQTDSIRQTPPSPPIKGL